MNRLTLLALLVVSAAASAERSLSLDDALSLARTRNRDLVAARARLDQASVGIQQAWVALIPTVALQGKYTHNYRGAELPLSALNQGVMGLATTLQGANSAAPPSAQNPALGPALDQFQDRLNGATSGSLPSTVVIQRQEQLDSSLNVTVPLVVPSAYATLHSAKRSFASSEASFEVTETNVLFSVAQTFFAAAGAEELLLARRNAVDVSKQTLANSQAKLAAGTAKRTDVNQAELSVVRAQQQLLVAQDQRAQAYRSLATLLQLEEPFRLSVSAVSTLNDPADSLTQHAVEHRPEFRQYLASAQAYSAQGQAADWRWSPTLSAFGRATYGNYAGFTGTNYTWAVGVQLDWLLYDAGNHDALKHLARAQEAEMIARLDAEKDSVRDDIRNAMENMTTSRQGVSASERAAALAKETLALMRVQYQAGLATQLDVLQAQDALVSSEVSLAQSRFTLALDTLTLARSAALFPEKKP